MATDSDWRIVPGFPDYKVSRDGEIIRFKPDARGHRLTGKPLKQMISKSGYAHLTLCVDGRVENVRVNRIVCGAFNGPPPHPGSHAAHFDGDRLNNHADNLRWANAYENEGDKRCHGTAPIGDNHWSRRRPECRSRGSRHGRSKLTEAAVRSIRSDARPQREIAKEHGVSQRVIWMVKRRMTWSHVA